MLIGLALSGGGAKGAAHIGALKALEEANIKIGAISGTSSGSIVASLYVCGYKAKDIYYIFKRYCKFITDYDNAIPLKMIGTLFTGKIKLKSLVKGKNLECILNNCTNNMDIRDVSIPLAIPAVDIIDGGIIYFSSKRIDKVRLENTTIYEDEPEYIFGGKISEIVRASTAFPGVFEPKVIGNHMLIDGGTRVNSPVSVLSRLNDNLDKKMVIYFEKTDNNKVPCNIVDTTVKAVDIMSHGLNSEEINHADYKVDIESRNVSLLDISKIDYMVNLGYKITKEYIKNNINNTHYY